MKVINIHPHLLSDGAMAFTFQIEHNGEIEPFVSEMTRVDVVKLILQLSQMLYEEVSK